MAKLRKKTVKKNGTAKKTKQKLYFGKEAHDAIIEYQSANSKLEKHKIYEDKIRNSFHKLAENLIFIHGFARDANTFDQLKSDCVSFLYETLEKFDPERGSKAFSYFNVCAKHYLIIQTNKRNKRNNRQVSLDNFAGMSNRDKKSVETFSYIPSPETQMIQKEDRERMFQVLKIIENRTRNQNEKLCIKAVEKLFIDIDKLEFLNKRAIFVYLREISGLNPKQLSVAMSNVRKNFRDVVGNNEEFKHMFNLRF